MTGSGPLADQLAALFDAIRRKHRLATGCPPLSTASFRRLIPGQGELF